MKPVKNTPSKRELLFLLAIYLLGFIVLAIRPYDRADWALENFFPISMLVVAITTYPYFKFSRLSYYMLFFYLFVQSYGGHFTYAMTPPFNWLRDEFIFLGTIMID